MYRRATAATHERHASVLAIHFTLRVSNESLFYQTEQTDKMGIEQDVMTSKAGPVAVSMASCLRAVAAVEYLLQE
jgi:hypothetical protein